MPVALALIEDVAVGDVLIALIEDVAVGNDLVPVGADQGRGCRALGAGSAG